ncbi:hypothetical protein LCGC14_3103700, partial [marine sediment metagenome]
MPEVRYTGEGIGEGVMNETTIEFVGGPLCGALTTISTDAAKVAWPGRMLGRLVEYVYQRTERVSVLGYIIFEYDHKR